MPAEYKNTCELVSLHSVSKGLLGECGLRGGYMYVHNFNPEITNQLVKLKSINLCSNSIGQLMVDLMCNPPLQDVQESTRVAYQREHKALFDSLKKRAGLVTNFLRGMKNITCNEVEGAMYAFPQIKFSNKAVEAAQGQAPDLFYCLEVLKNTGIALVPGSGFKQRPGTHHFRITTLILPEEELQHRLEDLKKFNDSFHKKYAWFMVKCHIFIWYFNVCKFYMITKRKYELKWSFRVLLKKKTMEGLILRRAFSSFILDRRARSHLQIIKALNWVLAFEFNQLPLPLHRGFHFEPILVQHIRYQVVEFSLFFLQLLYFMHLELGHSVDWAQTHFICFF